LFFTEKAGITNRKKKKTWNGYSYQKEQKEAVLMLYFSENGINSEVARPIYVILAQCKQPFMSQPQDQWNELGAVFLPSIKSIKSLPFNKPIPTENAEVKRTRFGDKVMLTCEDFVVFLP